MSRSQLGLAIMLVVIILLGLPAFLLPRHSTVKQHDDAPNGNAVASIPNTSLSLTKTTEDERKEIRYRRKVNINEAGKEELQTIPSIGPNMAEDILNYREDGNTFHRVSALDRIEGFGEKTVESIEEHVTVGRENRKEAPSQEDGGKLDINSATREQLTDVDGIGSVTADRILRYREENDGINTVEELDQIPGIGSSTVDRILPNFEGLSRKQDRPVEPKIDVNSDDESELTELSGIGTVTAGRIIDYRRENGDFSSLEDLKNVSGIGEKTVEDIKDAAVAR